MISIGEVIILDSREDKLAAKLFVESVTKNEKKKKAQYAIGKASKFGACDKGIDSAEFVGVRGFARPRARGRARACECEAQQSKSRNIKKKDTRACGGYR